MKIVDSMFTATAQYFAIRFTHVYANNLVENSSSYSMELKQQLNSLAHKHDQIKIEDSKFGIIEFKIIRARRRQKQWKRMPEDETGMVSSNIMHFLCEIHYIGLSLTPKSVWIIPMPVVSSFRQFEHEAKEKAHTFPISIKAANVRCDSFHLLSFTS